MFDPNAKDNLNEVPAVFQHGKVAIGYDAEVHKLERSYNKKEQEYAFLLNRRLRRAKHPDTPVVDDPLLDYRISEETNWYIKQKHQYPNVSSTKKKKDSKIHSASESFRSKSAPVRRTGQSEPPTSHQASLSSAHQLSASGRSKTPNRERIFNVRHANIGPGKWTPPKLRKTCMAVGYVHNTWPETNTAEYEKKMYQLQQANERKQELLKAIEEQMQHRLQAHQMTHAPLPVKEFMQMTEAEIREHQLREEKTRMLQHEVGQREAEIKELQTLFNRLRIETALNSITIGNHPTYYDFQHPLSESTASQRILKQSILASNHPEEKRVEKKMQKTLQSVKSEKSKVGNRDSSAAGKVKKSTAKSTDIKPTFEVEVKRKPPVDSGSAHVKIHKPKVAGLKKVKQKMNQDKYASIRPAPADKVEKLFADMYDNQNRAIASRAPSSYLQSSENKPKRKSRHEAVPLPSLARTEELLAQQDQETSRRLSLEDILSTTQNEEQHSQQPKSLSIISSSRAQVKKLLSASPLFKSHNLRRDEERIHKLESSVLSSTALAASQNSLLKSKKMQQLKSKQEKPKQPHSLSKSSKDRVVSSASESVVLSSSSHLGSQKEKKVSTKIALKRQLQEKALISEGKKKQKKSTKGIRDNAEEHMLDLPGYLEDLEAESERVERQFDERKQDPFFQSGPPLSAKRNITTDAIDTSYDRESDTDSQNDLFGFALNPTTATTNNSDARFIAMQASKENPDVLHEDTKNVVVTNAQDQQHSISTALAQSHPSRHSRALDRIAKNQKYGTGNLTAAKPETVVAPTSSNGFHIAGNESEDTLDRSTGYRPVANVVFPSEQQQMTTPQKSYPSSPPALMSGSPAPPARSSTGQQLPDAMLSPKTLLTNSKLLKRLEDREAGGDAATSMPAVESPQPVTSPAGMDSFTRANVIISIKSPGADDSPIPPAAKSTTLTSEDNAKLKKMRMVMPVVGKDLQPTIVSQFEKNRRYDHANVDHSSVLASIHLVSDGETIDGALESAGNTTPPKHTLSGFSAKKERLAIVQQKKKDKRTAMGNNPLCQSVESEVSIVSNATSSSAGSNRKKLTGLGQNNKKRSLAASWNAEESPRTWSAKQRQQQPHIKSSTDVKGQMNSEWQKIYDAISAVEVGFNNPISCTFPNFFCFFKLFKPPVVEKGT